MGKTVGDRESALRTADGIGTRRGALAVAGFNAALILWLLLKPGGATLFRTADNLAQAVGPGLALAAAVAACVRRGRGTEAAPGGRRLPSWPVLLILAGVGSYAVGQVLYTYGELRGHRASQLCLADVLYLLAHPCFVVGILSLPKRALPLAGRGRILLDGLVAMAAMVTFSWFFLLGPVLLNATTPVPSKAIGCIYPLADLVFIFCLLSLSYRASKPEQAPAIALLTTALSVLVITNSVYGYEILHRLYRTGTLLDAGWPLALMLIALGAYAAHLGFDEATDDHGGVCEVAQIRPVVWKSLAPYALVPAVGGLMLYTLLTDGDPKLELGVYVGAGVVLGLTLLRQVFAILENARLLESLHTAYSDLAHTSREIQRHAADVEKLNAELRAMQNELVQSAKLASLGTLAAGVAHELNQPVAVIRGVAQQICDVHEEALPPDALSDLRLIEGQTGRMMKIIQHLRTFSRAGNDERKPVNVNDVVQSCFVLVGQQLRAHDVEVVFDLCEEPPAVLADANELEQVFLNLITNARDAMEGAAEKQLTIATWVERVAPAASEGAASGDRMFVVEVSDTGPGIPEEIATRVFDPFFTTKDAGKGTGLGLSISHSIIRKHCGTIQIRETAEHIGEDGGTRGACFVVTLPAMSAEAAQPEKAAREAA